MVERTPTVTELLLARADDARPGLRFEDREWSWAEHVRRSAELAALLRARHPTDGPPHVGVLLDNVPEFSFLLGAAALSGTVLAGLNPGRRGAALARDVRLADCALVITEPRHAPLLDSAELDAEVLVLGSPEWERALAAHRGAPLDPVPATPDDLFALLFTSGTGGEPKAVRCTHGKVAFPGRMLADRFRLGGRDGTYVSMPLFHSNALFAGWAVGLAAGAAISLRRRFSASEFLSDVRRFGATYANYVGTPLSYVLATPPRPNDADNPLRIAYGNEGAERDLARFAERFGCRVVDGFGSTEGGIAIARTPDAPPGSLGRPGPGVAVLHPDTGRRCAVAVFDRDGRLANPDEAVGELVNTAGAGWFAGYYGAPEDDARRMGGGMYRSGDLGYVDADGFCYFAGRSAEWLRVGGENLGAAPIERVLLRHPAIAHAAVYAVPDPAVGDQVMAALVLADELDDLGDFLAAQPDLGPKQLPRFVRIAAELPRTGTHKVLKRELAAQRWNCPDPVWWRPGPDPVYEVLPPERAAELDRRATRPVPRS
ncbi:long-chain-fatty-acid--CoA ligase [Saccharopolyspora sp. 7B]|uniref:long-chain-fatty-acid--CoA ligase n=1 Tax=Saccharopolyspora sp. 7B TaxID=2877240 RepID=UPI001CD3007D|nr:long-chain-fatty-acid--CoA ligase [Saccharopolyspora sp. 7B]MCA1280375.1 long-chain-fatty-acid--CoA ligase [Saccharopolyspora sp. 7B]